MASCNFETMRISCVAVFLYLLPASLWGQSQTVWLDYQKVLTKQAYAARYEEVLTKTDSVWQVQQFSLPEHKLTARYAILEPDSRFRHGTCLQYHANGRLADSGYYSQGYREGWHFSWYDNGQLASRCKYRNDLPIDTCTTWYTDGKMSGLSICKKPGDGYRTDLFPNQQVKAFGPLVRGKKFGRWKFLDESERTMVEVRFFDDWPQATTCYNPDGSPSKDTCIYESPPTYVEGLNAWNRFIARESIWPEGLIMDQPGAFVKVRFTVFKDGSIGHFEVLESEHPLLSKDALRVLSKAGRWKPALYLNQPVDYSFTQTFHFKSTAKKYN